MDDKKIIVTPGEQRLAAEGDPQAAAIYRDLAANWRTISLALQSSRENLMAPLRVGLEWLENFMAPLRVMTEQLTELTANLASASNVRVSREWVTFTADVGKVYNEGDEEALQRLATSKLLTRGRVFHHMRWLGDIAYAFNEYKEDRSWEESWKEQVLPALFIAIKDIPDDLDIFDVYRHLRRETCKGIEKSLLGGRTLDTISEEALPQDEEAPALEQEYELQSLFEALDLRQKIGPVSADDLELLECEYGEIQTLAKQRGRTPAALWKERERLRKRIKQRARKFEDTI